MKRSTMPLGGLALCAGLHAASCFGQQPDAAQAPQEKRWEFEAAPAWQDEFDYTGAPDPAKWGYDIGGHGWGNNELQYYTDSTDNALVADGVLTIAARKQKKEGRNYTSARVISKGKGDFLYGRFEIKAKLASGKGTWPALWMLPTDSAYGGWPKSGEMDIMEHVGFDPNRVHVSIHTESYYFQIKTQKTATKIIDGAMDRFHLYRVDWTPDAIRGYIDDALVLEFPNEGKGYRVWPFDKRFHLLMNIAVGGDWGGQQGVDDDSFPARMQIDYVRVYRLIGK